MSVLTRDEIKRRLIKGELVAGRTPASLKIEPASIDLTAGRIIWSQPGTTPKGRPTRFRQETEFVENASRERQPYVVLRPGQMVSVITREELAIPVTLCATVFSKNRLALNGIFAFNAGHVDPGYKGPIVIRLISLRATDYTITLGDPIFTVVFHKLAADGINDLPGLPYRGRRRCTTCGASRTWP